MWKWRAHVCYKGESGNHSRVNDIQQWDDYNEDRIALNVSNSSDDEDMIGASQKSIDWFKNNMGMSDYDAAEAAEIFLEYSRRGDTPLHENTNVEGNDLLDKIIHARNAPVFSGEQHRGIYIDQDVLKKLGAGNITPVEYMQRIIQSGRWKEPGATSFSASESIARSFARVSYSGAGEVSVLIHYSGGRSGFPMRHLSSFPGENEVLHSRRQMRNGMRIRRHKTERSSYGGTIFHIYVDD